MNNINWQSDTLATIQTARHIYPKYLDTLNPNRTTFLKFKHLHFNPSPAEPGYTLPLQTGSALFVIQYVNIFLSTT